MISGATLLILRVQAHYSYLEYRPPSHLSVQVQAFGLHSKLQCSKVQAFGLYSKCEYRPSACTFASVEYLYLYCV